MPANDDLVNLTKAVALESAERGVLVNAIAPGSIPTEMVQKLWTGDHPVMASRREVTLSHIARHRFAKTKAIANAAVFLVAPRKKYLTGAVLTVAGGWTAGYSRDFSEPSG